MTPEPAHTDATAARPGRLLATTSAVRFLFNAYQPPALPSPPVPAPPGAACALSGEPIATGYRLGDVTSDATADLADTFRAGGGWLSEEAARLFKDWHNMAGGILALPDRGLKPLISRGSATDERPCWRDILTSLAPGTLTIAVLTLDTKKRLWPRARLSTFGARWQPYLHDGTVSRSLAIDVARLRECLALVERIYTLGFSKQAIAGGLLDISATRAARAVGIAETMRLERELARWRGTDELLLAVFVAQKSDVPSEEDSWRQEPISIPSPAQLSLF